MSGPTVSLVDAGDPASFISNANPLPVAVQGTVPVTVGGTVTLTANSALSLTPSATFGNGGSFKWISTVSTNIQLVKTGACALAGGLAWNATTSPRYLKLYNKATAPVIGTDVPLFTIPLPGNAVAGDADPVNIGSIVGSYGFRFSAGLYISITEGMADGDATPTGAGDVIANLSYT